MTSLKFFIIASIICLLLIATGCSDPVPHHQWTEREIKEFECKCSQTDTFNNLIISFTGFGNKEFDSVLVREYQDTLLCDSFKMFVFPATGPWEIKNKKRSGHINRTMNTKYNYQFIVPGHPPYELANMKMIVWSAYPGYDCVMGDFRMNGIRFQNDANPEIKKWNRISNSLQLMQGEWVHEKDKLSAIEISDRRWNYKYNGKDTDTYYFNIAKQLPQYVDTSVKSEFLILSNGTDTMYYELLSVTDSLLSLMHFPSGQLHMYLRKKE